ncbi:periplasmic heavy metal sensor, partial [Roseivivax sp. CAU 1761]
PRATPLRRPGRGLRIALLLSLALNLAVAGIVAGAWLDQGPPRHAARHGGPEAPFLYFRALTEPQRRALRRELRAALATPGGAARAEFAAGYGEALAALQADPFDAERLTEVLRRQEARAARHRAQGRKVLTGFLAKLPEAERAAYAARLAVEIERLDRRGGGRDGSDGTR